MAEFFFFVADTVDKKREGEGFEKVTRSEKLCFFSFFFPPWNARKVRIEPEKKPIGSAYLREGCNLARAPFKMSLSKKG